MEGPAKYVHMAHFLDVMTNIPSESINFDNLKAIIRDKAWAELPEALQPAQRPTAEERCSSFSCTSGMANSPS